MHDADPNATKPLGAAPAPPGAAPPAAPATAPAAAPAPVPIEIRVVVDQPRAAPARRAGGRLRFALRLASLILLAVPALAGWEAYATWTAAYEGGSARQDAAHSVALGRSGRVRYVTPAEKKALDVKADRTYVIIGASLFAAVVIHLGLGLRR